MAMVFISTFTSCIRAESSLWPSWPWGPRSCHPAVLLPHPAFSKTPIMRTSSVPFVCETEIMVSKPSLPLCIRLLGSWNSQFGAGELVIGFSNPRGLMHKTLLVG